MFCPDNTLVSLAAFFIALPLPQLTLRAARVALVFSTPGQAFNGVLVQLDL